MMVRRSNCRPGISILEVIIALAIFLMSLVAISRIVEQAADLAIQTDERTHASMLAQSKLAEVVAGVEPLQSHGDAAIDGQADWYWKLDANPDSIPGLYKVVVTVSKETPQRRIEVAFHQYVLDPTRRGSTDSSTIGSDETTGTGGTP